MYPTAPPVELMRQAGITAGVYFETAIGTIDNNFGKGYAKAHPELIAAFMQAACSDYNSGMLGVYIGDVMSDLDSIVRGLQIKE